MAFEYELGTTIDDITDLMALGLAAYPRGSYRPFSDAIRDANGVLHGVGFPVAEWHWDIMKPGESDILAEFLDGALSAPVFIRTRLNRLATNEYTWATYSAVMNWPSGDEDVQAKRSVGMTITFTRLVLIQDET